MRIEALSVGAWFKACGGKKIGLLLEKSDAYANIALFDENLSFVGQRGVPQFYEVDFIGYSYVKDSSLFCL